ncbi:MAG: hypothetical protein A2096_07170 [Spirochaetes bacterium GWF1_41_5]|nr:MAG: hypothetical protein A2096_07170 [Spirochaetes bacterium GWF1_41_5]
MKYRILIKQVEDSMLAAERPLIPDCISPGKTRREVLPDIQETIREHLAGFYKYNEATFPLITEELAEAFV